MTENWQLLSCIFNSLGRLDHPLYQPLAHDSYPREYRLLALESALRSGEIPMHGCRVTSLGLASSERIETKIDVETAIDIPLDEITLYKFYPEGPERIEFAVFKRVQADMASVEQCLRENEPKATGDEAPDDIEAECRKWLAALPEHPRLTKEQRRKSFNESRKAKTIGVRPFKRAWRESAHPAWRKGGRRPGA